MNPAVPNAPAQGGQEQQAQRPNIVKMILMYMAINYVFTNFFGGNKGAQQGPGRAFPNLYNNDEPFEFKMFISDKNEMDNTSVLVWEEKDIEYNFNKENYREKTLEFNIDDLINKNNNFSLYAHIYLSSLRPESSGNYSFLQPYLIRNATIDLIDWRKKDANLDQENLLFKEDKDKPELPANFTNLTEDSTKFPHLRSKVWIQLIHDSNVYGLGQVPAEMNHKLVNLTEGDTNLLFYIPALDVSQFWARKKDFTYIDPLAENKTINSTFYFNTYWMYKYMLEGSMQKSGSMYAEFGIMDNMDELKEMVLDANPYLFGVTIIVSLLHSLFEFLALKNEIAFWKNLESHKGLSLRSLWVSLITELIVLLYLFDNDTSFLILISSFAGLGVTVWKIIKTTKFKRKPTFPYVEFDYQDAYKSTTQQYDQVASKYLFWLLIPLLSGYTVYSLIYEKHKGWYSFVVQTLVGFIYVFGFIEMTPQLYINYKLKSVEHLPWRVLIYKFLNTIVDDLFAFVITMPWLKRLSCFRDDIIFLIYLYQRWIYRVDKTRDPYGVKKDDGAAPVAGEDKKDTKALPSTKNMPVTKKKMGADRNVTQRNVQSSQEGKASETANGSDQGNKKTN